MDETIQRIAERALKRARKAAQKKRIDRGENPGGKGHTALAEMIGVTPHAVMQWDAVPERRVDDVAEATGVPAEELRPDLHKE